MEHKTETVMRAGRLSSGALSPRYRWRCSCGDLGRWKPRESMAEEGARRHTKTPPLHGIGIKLRTRIEQAIARGERATTTMTRLGIPYEVYKRVKDEQAETSEAVA